MCHLFKGSKGRSLSNKNLTAAKKLMETLEMFGQINDLQNPNVKLWSAARQKTCWSHLIVRGNHTYRHPVGISPDAEGVPAAVRHCGHILLIAESEGQNNVKVCDGHVATAVTFRYDTNSWPHALTCSWSCIYSLQWPETWWTGEFHSHQTHRALERLEKPLHRSSDLKLESLKTQTNRQPVSQPVTVSSQDPLQLAMLLFFNVVFHFWQH